MTTTTPSPEPTVSTPAVPVGVAPSIARQHGAAAVRIGFGVVWAVDATFEWLPGFVHGQTLEDELGAGSKVRTPVIHQWIQLWHAVGTWHSAGFAVVIALLESVIALALIVGAFSNLVFVGSAILSFGIWSGAEGFHLPWSRSGITDLGPSVGYIAASLALLCAAAGATWSLDDRSLRRRFGPRLTSPASYAEASAPLL